MAQPGFCALFNALFADAGTPSRVEQRAFLLHHAGTAAEEPRMAVSIQINHPQAPTAGTQHTAGIASVERPNAESHGLHHRAIAVCLRCRRQRQSPGGAIPARGSAGRQHRGAATHVCPPAPQRRRACWPADCPGLHVQQPMDPGAGPHPPLLWRAQQRTVRDAGLLPVLTMRAAIYRAAAAPTSVAVVCRLTWLGDAALGAAVSELLYRRLPSNATTAQLHFARVARVSREACATAAGRLGLASLMVVGKSFEGSQPSPAMLAGAATCRCMPACGHGATGGHPGMVCMQRAPV